MLIFESLRKPINSLLLLLGNVFEVSNDIGSFLWLLQPRKCHLRPRNVLFRILEVYEERFIGPGDTFGLVGFGVLVIGEGTGFATE
jgi:hypothetical protein